MGADRQTNGFSSNGHTRHDLSFRRRVVQTLSLLAYHSSWGPELKWLCTPVLSCHSCALAWFACPIGVLVHYAGWHVFPYVALGTMVLFGVLLGRLFCGWVCPFGFLQDLLYKIPSKKFTLPGWTKYGKYAVLVVFVVAVPFYLGAETLYSFCRACPAAALQVSIPSVIMEGWPQNMTPVAVRLGFLVFVLGLAVFSSRWFCKVVCPIAVLLAPLNLISFWRVKIPAEDCLSCRKCNRTCSMQADPERLIARRIEPNRHPECISCYECRDACPLHTRSNGKSHSTGTTGSIMPDETTGLNQSAASEGKEVVCT